MHLRQWLTAIYAVVIVACSSTSARVFGTLGCRPFDPDSPEPRGGPRADRVIYQVNRKVWDELLIIKDGPQSRYADRALALVKDCSVRRLDDASMRDLELFKTRCKQPFTSQEAADLKDEFEAQFLIVQTLRYILKNERPDSQDELQDFRTRQIRFGLRVHEAIARSMELLPLPLKLYPGTGFASFIAIVIIIGLLIIFALVGAITALVEREPERIQDGLLRLHRLWNRAKVTVFQAEWDKNKVSVSTYPLAKANHNITKRSI